MSNESEPAVGADLIGERRHLLSLAFRMLGTVAEAEDAVQETYIRWYRLDQAERDEIVTRCRAPSSPGPPAGSALTCSARPGPGGNATLVPGCPSPSRPQRSPEPGRTRPTRSPWTTR